MERLSGVSLRLSREVKNLEGDLSRQINRLKKVEIYMERKLKKVRRLLKTMPNDNGVKTLPMIVDYLSEIQTLLGKLQDVNLDKGDEYIDHDIEITEIIDEYMECGEQLV